MVLQVSEDGTYWTVLDDATQEEVLCQSYETLSDVLLDFTIRDMVSNMFGVMKDPKTWSAAVHAYAFGDTFGEN